MQNKPNLLDAQMNASVYYTKIYNNETAFRRRKNKPNSNPIKPNFQKAQMNVNLTLTKDYRKKDDFAVRKNKPNFRNGQNERKLTYNKRLQKKRCFRSPKNKPNQSQFQKPISAPKEWQENKAVMVTHRRHEYQSQILRTRFIRRFFGLTVRFFTHLGVEFGFDYLFGQGCTKIKEERLIALPLFLKEEEC
jgi:hypothetical protein